MENSAETLRQSFNAAGQGHVFAYWDELSGASQAQLLAQASEIDLDETAKLYETLVKGEGEEAQSLEGLTPAPYEAHPSTGGDTALWAAMKASGEAALREGKVAAFVVAGGQGTRLGYEGPKGTFPTTPLKEKPLFQIFAEKIQAAQTRYGCTIPWFIMTSGVNHEATLAAFKAAGFWGLNKANVHFFMQGRMAAVDDEGKIILEAKDSIAMSPDGHGGSLRALVRSGAAAKMQALGIDVISYFQVDNPLVQFIDPTFIGFHREAKSDMSSKMVRKAYALEKVGHFCSLDGRSVVIEYSDLPESIQEQTDADGELLFEAGSIAIHLLSLEFVSRVGAGEAAYALPFHRAHKKIARLQNDGSVVKPSEPNGYKFEMFVFDALPYAQNPVIIETLRQDDFSPVKNAEGVDSPESSKQDQMRQWVRWAKAAGVEIATDESGLPAFAFEVSPLFADSPEAFAESWAALDAKPEFKEGLCLG
jgi:UDP-N-acetylglucosamine/UDP-N-acetylgalactosamine diphosphorylase|tara:strand:+ start:18653 stop:20083 length:1431 start_codon:yes stop_codon:yes gene_type:complete